MSDNQVIPEAAVEAAARGIAEADPLWPDCAWEDAPGKLRDEALAMAGCALEAAAPHMLAGAWDDGYLALADDTFRDQELRKRGGKLEHPTPNPYRPIQ